MKTSVVFLTLFLLVVWTGNSSCNPDDACKGQYLADLALDAFGSAFERVENGKEYYAISHTVINFVGDILECQSNAATAEPNQFRQRILFSDNPNFTNPTLADELSFPLDALAPGSRSAILDNLAFTENGYYLFHSIADYTGVVDERNEGNNEDNNPLDRAIGARPNGGIIHVTQSSPVPVYDSLGNRVFVKRISTTVRYE